MKTQKFLIGIIAIALFFSVAARTCAALDGEGEKREANKEPGALSTEEQLILLNEKVRRLEEMVERQQRMIETLQAGSAAAETKTTAKPEAGEVLATSATLPASEEKKQEVSNEQTKKLDSLYKSFGQLNISGELRFRYDTQIDQGVDSPVQLPDRNRLRVRARVQLAGQYYKYFDWGVRISSGRFTNPTSGSQDITDFFDRKPLGFDRYFIRYNTKTEPVGVILQGGKFDYPWKRTELTFDNDLQPEGAAETIYYKGKSALKDLRLVAFQLPFNEVAAGKDSVLYGGQVLGTLGSADWSFTGSATYLNFNQVDALARALNRPTTQVGGGLEFGTTNRVRRDAAGNIVGFQSNFNIIDTIGELTYTGFKKYPITLLFDYARNMSNRLDRLGDRNAYWTDFRVGRLKEKGDLEFTYTFARIEQDAVLSPFSYDDFLGSNSRNNRFTAGYMVNNNVFVQLIGLFTQRLNTLPGNDNRVAKRFQFDVYYKW